MGFNAQATATLSGGRIVYICATVLGALVIAGSLIAHAASKSAPGWGWGILAGSAFLLIGGVLLVINIATDGKAP